jgi:hypothetical protein
MTPVTDTANARISSTGQGPRSFRHLQFLDWVFVGFSWLTVLWFIFNIFERFNERPFNRIFDILPVAAGVLVITFGWWALRLGKRLEQAVSRLDGAGLERTGDLTIEVFLETFRRQVTLYSRWIAAFITVFMSGGFLMFVFQQSGVYDSSVFFFNGLLGIVMAFTGCIIGMLLGRLVGYANLWRAMEKSGIRIASLATQEARSAVGGIERVFGYAVIATTTLCHWSAVWWIVWELGYDPFEYREPWEPFTLGIWVISFGLFIFAGLRPIRTFHKRLDQLYGGTEARNALDQQLKEAEEDRRRLFVAKGDRNSSTELHELDAFIADIAARRFRSPWLNPRVLGILIAWNALLFLLPLGWSLATAGVMINGSQYVGVRINVVIDGSAAATAGLRIGDIVTSIDGQKIRYFVEMHNIVANSAGRILNFQLQRDRSQIELKVAPRRVSDQSKDRTDSAWKIGVQ